MLFAGRVKEVKDVSLSLESVSSFEGSFESAYSMGRIRNRHSAVSGDRRC